MQNRNCATNTIQRKEHKFVPRNLHPLKIEIGKDVAKLSVYKPIMNSFSCPSFLSRDEMEAFTAQTPESTMKILTASEITPILAAIHRRRRSLPFSDSLRVKHREMLALLSKSLSDQPRQSAVSASSEDALGSESKTANIHAKILDSKSDTSSSSVAASQVSFCISDPLEPQMAQNQSPAKQSHLCCCYRNSQR